MGIKSKITALLGATALTAVAGAASAQVVTANTPAGGPAAVTIAPNGGTDENIGNENTNSGPVSATGGGAIDTITAPSLEDSTAEANNNSATGVALGNDADNDLNALDDALGDGDAAIGNANFNNGAINTTITGVTVTVGIAGDVDATSSIQANNTSQSGTAAANQATNSITGDFGGIALSGTSSAVFGAADTTAVSGAAGAAVAAGALAVGSSQANEGAVASNVTGGLIDVDTNAIAAGSDGIDVLNTDVSSDGNGNIALNSIAGSIGTSDSGIAIASSQTSTAAGTVDATATSTVIDVDAGNGGNDVAGNIDVLNTSVSSSARVNRAVNAINVNTIGDGNDFVIANSQLSDANSTASTTTVTLTINAADTVTNADLTIANGSFTSFASGNLGTNTIDIGGNGVGSNSGINSDQTNTGTISASVTGVSAVVALAGDPTGANLSVSNNALRSDAIGNQATNRISIGN